MNWNSLTGRRDDEAAAPATFYFEWRRRRRAVYAPRRTVSIPLLPTPAPPRGMPKSKSAATPRARPNVLITGTPGTGKTSLAERVAAACGMHHHDVSAVAKREDMCESFDEDLDTHVIDEDKVLDHMEEKLGASDGGIVADYHSCDLFPERWFDLVVVLTCDNSILYDRLAARGYAEAKITKNVECEIFQAIAEEARESYAEDVVRVCASETIEQMEANEASVKAFVDAFDDGVGGA